MGKGKVYRDLFADRKETNINITVVCRLRKKWLIFGAVTSSETRRRTGSICISRKKTNSKQLKISDIKGDFEVFLLKTLLKNPKKRRKPKAKNVNFSNNRAVKGSEKGSFKT